MDEITLKKQIQSAIQAIGTTNLKNEAVKLLKVLGYESELTLTLAGDGKGDFLSMFDADKKFRKDMGMFDQWNKIDLLFQLTTAQITKQNTLFGKSSFNKAIEHSYLFFAIELKDDEITRGKLAQITREVNRLTKQSALIFFKYGSVISLAIIDRRLNKKEESKSVLEKVTLIKDISTETPNRAHIEILFDLSLFQLVQENVITSWEELHKAWQKALDTKALNKRFFQDLANWYFWAMDHADFPDDVEKKKDIRNATNLIRLVTRIIFIWFIKEKQFVPEKLFRKHDLKTIVKDFDKNKKQGNYYNAILQNLFFGTLNQKMGERKFVKDTQKYVKEDYGVKNLYRYPELFNIKESEVVEMFKDIPFLNGGLFDCLDKYDDKNTEIFVDGFTRKEKKRAFFPDFLFFSDKSEYDLNEVYGTKNKKYSVEGIIDILNGYKFTVTENTPIEEEVALDPELLGKVFENLLASYNPETQTTARKQTGSFYTPREIVNYMVDESLLAYLKQAIESPSNKDTVESDLRELLSYSESPNPFSSTETNLLIEAIDKCKILDPACGSGAFPMGVLHKLVHLLHKLDIDNSGWRQLQRKKAISETEEAYKIGDKEVREKMLLEINDVFDQNVNEPDYARKLYLIENSIYGVDIQPIAVQIAKLRFFISLVIDQKKNDKKENIGIRSLPNLETKFVAANTLIGLEKPAQTFLRNREIEKKENELKELRHKYFTAKTRKEKLKHQEQDKELRKQIAILLEDDGWNTKVAKQIVAFDPYDQNQHAEWFDPEWMFGKDLETGFNIVIGNPPYVNVEKYGKGSSYIENIKKQYPKIWMDKSDILFYFIAKGASLTKTDLIYIISNAFLFSDKASKLRNFICSEFPIKKIINFENYFAFDNALITTAIVHFNKQFTNKSSNVLNIKEQLQNDVDLYQYLNDKSKYDKIAFQKNDVFALSDSKTSYLNKLIDGNHPKLGDLLLLGSGMQTGANEIYASDSFPKSFPKKYIKHHLTGVSIEQFTINKFKTGELLYVEEVDNFNELPEVIQKYLNENQRILKNRADKKRRSTAKWWNYTFAMHKEYYNLKKIWTSYRGKNNCFALDESTKYIGLTNTAVIFDTNPKQFNIKYILGILNSKLMDYRYKSIGKQTGNGMYEYLENSLTKIPIVRLSVNDQELIVNIVNYIILSIENELNEKTYYKTLLNAIIYELYLQKTIISNGCGVISYLDIIEYKDDWSDDKKIKSIKSIYKILNSENHPVKKALFKMDTIDEIRNIEGKQ